MIYKFLVNTGIAAIVAIFAVGCSTVDDTLGLDRIPGDQEMDLLSAEFSGINCYLTQDTLPSSNLGVAFFGTMQSPDFGVTEASAVLQYLPGGFKDEAVGFGYLPVVDSMKIYLALSSFTGNKVPGQKFKIFALDRGLQMDSTYYSGFEVDKYYDDNAPLFEFEYTDTTSNYVLLNSIGSAGTDLLKKLVDTDVETYKKDTSFLKIFKGLYIISEPSVNKDKQIFAAVLEDSHLMMYYHNHDKDKVVDGVPSIDTAILNDNKDTLSFAYYFDDGTYSNNVSINVLKHQYGTNITDHIVTDTLDLDGKSVTTAYVQNLAGVSTYLQFTPEFVESLLNIKNQAQGDHKNVIINKAEVRFYMKTSGVGVPPTIDAINAAPTRLGMYYNYQMRKPMPDYYYLYEQQGGVLPYGGYLNRSLGCYSMDITVYIQQLLLHHEKMPKIINLAPDVSTTYTFGQVVLNAPTDVNDAQRIKVKVTYTLLE